jgi:cytidylate kinase
MIVTIDGPAGAGKSTTARALAERLGFQFLDTGAMYRAVTWRCLSQQIDLGDEPAVAAAALRMTLRLEGERVFVDGVEATHAIRTTEITDASRFVAANNAVREHLVELQRRLAAGRDVVTEGRDQGTVAFPDAQCKIFLVAAPHERALRRQRDLAARGENVPVAEILEQQSQRDRRDEQREFGALRPAADAITVDTSNMTFAEVVANLEQIVRKRQREIARQAP